MVAFIISKGIESHQELVDVHASINGNLSPKVVVNFLLATAAGSVVS